MSRGRVERSAEMPDDADLEDGMEGVKPAKLSRIFLLAKPEWPWLAVGLIFLTISLSPAVLLPMAFGRMMDDLASSADDDERRRKVDEMSLNLVILLVVAGLATLFRSFIFNAGGERVVARLRIRLFTAIVSQDIGLFDKRKTGELLSRLGSDTTSMQDVATSNLSMFFRGFFQLGMSAGLMIVTSWRLSLMVFLVVPAVAVGIALYARRVRKLAAKYSDALGSWQRSTPMPWEAQLISHRSPSPMCVRCARLPPKALKSRSTREP
eukprot:TRINITY_DN38932_c0_g1_i3.p1 TRINITY_DN38932_c0_g1~~TRINITY_DN38932_c0_g1_i3.p1  ORF type:complete len:266 (+),score=11.12 TRINITY_DN38932_c0_g1_i3:151-948(+)